MGCCFVIYTVIFFWFAFLIFYVWQEENLIKVINLIHFNDQNWSIVTETVIQFFPIIFVNNNGLHSYHQPMDQLLSYIKNEFNKHRFDFKNSWTPTNNKLSFYLFMAIHVQVDMLTAAIKYSFKSIIFLYINYKEYITMWSIVKLYNTYLHMISVKNKLLNTIVGIYWDQHLS